MADAALRMMVEDTAASLFTAETEAAAPVAVRDAAAAVEAEAFSVVLSAPSSSLSSHPSESSPSSELALVVAEAEAATDVAAAVSVGDATVEAEEMTELELAEAEDVEFDPSIPPVTPVASIRANASDSLSQDKLVPAEFTRGRAKHEVPLAHSVTSQADDTHCANPPLTHA